MILRLKFRDGLLWAGDPFLPPAVSSHFRRLATGNFIAPAYQYSSIMNEAREAHIPVVDDAAKFGGLNAVGHSEDLDPFDFQVEAIRAWEQAGRRGTIVLPTGAGKSYMTRLLIAMLGMKDTRCSTLILVPTRVLLYQWHTQLQRAFQQPVGLVGDDRMDLQPITVSTYASARAHMSWFGNRWKLIVFDELHRKLSDGPSGNVARFSIAPYRLGLTATPIEKEQELLNVFVGPIVYSRTTEEMIERDVLSVYTTRVVHCRPTDDEVNMYFDIRKPMDALWHEAKEAHRIQGNDWFVHERRRNPDGAALAIRSVLRANRFWGSIPSRILRLREILQNHSRDRVLIFADSRAAAYDISRSLLVPPITADIGGDEREVYLTAFTEGKCRVLVTARALEEGVDLPDANVAVILAGRKHRQKETIQFIQRRGRVLRKRDGKKAVVYEVSWSLPRKKAAPP